MSTPPGTRTGILWDDTHLARLVTAATAGTSGGLRAAVLSHLATPSTPAVRLAADLEVYLGIVRTAYHHCRTSTAVHELVGSNYYPHRLQWAAATSTITEWRRSPDRPARIAAHEPVMSETVEIHPTRGTCNYSCAMCLWSDQKELTYTTQFLDTSGLLNAHEWRRRQENTTHNQPRGDQRHKQHPRCASVVVAVEAEGAAVVGAHFAQRRGTHAAALAMTDLHTRIQYHPPAVAVHIESHFRFLEVEEIPLVESIYVIECFTAEQHATSRNPVHVTDFGNLSTEVPTGGRVTRPHSTQERVCDTDQQ